MKLELTLVFSAICLFGLGVAGNVVDLGDDNFNSQLEGFDTALVMFYAPWCGHCKKLKPEFEKAAGELLSHEYPVNLVKVDCTDAGKQTCGRFEVRGYPTIKIFRSGELSSDYNGPRDADGIKKFMIKQVGPASRPVSSEEELKKLLSTSKDVRVVSYSEDDKEKALFEKVSSALRDSVSFAHLNSKTKEFSGIVLHRPTHLASKMEESHVKFEGKSDKETLTKWIFDNYHGIVGHRVPDNAKDFKFPLVVAYFDVDYVKNIKGTNYWRNRVMKVGKSFPNINFAISNKEDHLGELSEFGMDTPSTPDQKAPIVTFRDKDSQKFVMTEAFTVDSFKQFLEDYEAGKLSPYTKSEEVPDNSDNDVKVIVGKNFKELITDEKEKDILLEFYAPWCGHCKKLSPIYDELGAAMKDENVIIAKTDATANDVPSTFNVKGFPTIYWIPAGGKPVSYEGGREKEDFIKYIAENAQSDLKGFDRQGNPKKTEL